MKRYIFMAVTFLMISAFGFAQTATTRTDYSGNKITTYINQYGQPIGTATTRTDYSGNKNTTYTNQYGQPTGTATTRTDYSGNKTTTYYDQYGRPIK